MAAPEPTRLENWKQIAGYLGKSISAVQRWEKEEGLPVHRHEHQSLASVFAYPEELDAWLESRRKRPPVPEKLDPPAVAGVESTSQLGSRPWTRRLWIGAGLAAVAGASAAFWRVRHPSMVMRPLFHGPTNERTPSISADGRYVLYEEIDSTGIRQRLFDSRTQENRTLDSYPLASGACESRISPDGKVIAFLTMAERNLWDVQVRGREGGPARKIARLDGVGLNWSPDSQTLAATSRPAQGGPVSVYSIHHLFGNQQLVSRPPAASWGDIEVAVSPDGIHLGVLRYAARGDGDVWLLSWDGRVERRLTNFHTWINGLTFTQDGQEIVFAPVGTHLSRLYRTSIDGRRLSEIPTPGTSYAMKPKITGTTLLFEDRAHTWRIHRGRIEGQTIAEERLFTPMTGGTDAMYPAYSPDGSQVAWSQGDGIWIKGEGPMPRKLVGHLDDRREVVWSADGRHLAVTVRDGTQWRVWTVDAQSGRMDRLTKDNANEGRAIWSPTGTYVYWRSERGGEPRYYRRPWPGGSAEPEPVSPFATEGGPSVDDQRFYYLENDQRSALFEFVIGAGSRPRRLDHIPLLKPGHWSVRGNDIVYADTHATGKMTGVFRAPIAGGAADLRFMLPVNPDGLLNLSVSPDLTEALWTRDERQEDVWIVENFR